VTHHSIERKFDDDSALRVAALSYLRVVMKCDIITCDNTRLPSVSYYQNTFQGTIVFFRLMDSYKFELLENRDNKDLFELDGLDADSVW